MLKKGTKEFFSFFRGGILFVVSAILLYTTFRSGYIMLLDWPLYPFIRFSDINFWTDPIGSVLYKFFSIIFTPDVFQRVFLFGVIFLVGMAGFRLAKKTNNIYAQYFAGLFLIFNPFIYARLVEQTMIVGGGSIAFLWFLVYFLEYLEERKNKKLVIASVLAALAVSFFAHSIFFIGLASVAFLFFDYVSKRDWKFVLRSLSILWIIIIALNLNWIVTSLTIDDSTWASNVKNFTQADLSAFETSDIGDHSVYVTVLSLQGYWGEYQDRFVSIQENPLWPIAFIFIFALAVFGTIKQWKKDPFVKPLVLLFFVSFVLAIGIASPLIKPLALFLYDHVPLYIGLREPQKWVVVMVFVYAYFGGWGIKHLLEIKKIKNYKNEIGIFCAILSIIFSFPIIKGMHEHFTPHEFPIEWRDARQYLNKNVTNGKTLFFPWHSYLEFDFANKNILNPAKAYFGKNIISGNNIEFGGVYSNFTDIQTETIQKYVLGKGDMFSFESDMKILGIDKVILAKAEDWQDYQWLDNVKGVKKVLENDKLIIYKL